MKARDAVTWITSLSLDAPVVVLVWQHAVAAHHSIDLSFHHRALVFAAVWLGYTADRWFDAWRHQKNISRRHSFHAISRWMLLGLWICVLAISLTVSVAKLEADELRNGLYLAIVSIGATGIIQLNKFGNYQTIAKSAFTASLVTSSVLIFSAPESIDSTLKAIATMTPLFFFNCVLIHSWDWSIDILQAPDDHRKAPRFTIPVAAILTFGVSITLFSAYPLALYAAASALLLLAIHYFRNHLHVETRRTLADLTLLTPLITFF